MQPLLIWSSHSAKTNGDSWALGRLVATLILIFGAVFVIIWRYGSSISGAQSLTSARDGLSAVSANCSTLLAVGATVFMMVTILHVLFKFPFAQHCVPESPSSWTSEKTASEKGSDSPTVGSQACHDDDDEIISYSGETVDLYSDPNIQFFDVASASELPDLNTVAHDDTLMSGVDNDQMVKCWLSLESSIDPDDQDVLNDQDMLSASATVTLSTTTIDLPGAGQPDSAPSVCKKDAATETDDLPKPETVSVGTMTSSPQLADASVSCQNTYKLVKTSNTTTSGPFMKKLRRAERLLKEARLKLSSERHSKLVSWTGVLARYKDRLQCLTQALEKKDVLLSYTALNKALSENEIKDMCTAVSSARDRLLTQCKLNAALKDVVVSKCDTITSAPASQTAASQS